MVRSHTHNRSLFFLIGRIAGSFLLLSVLILMPGGSRAGDLDSLKDGLYARFDTTRGTIVARLFYKKVPMTVANFAGLAEGTRDSNQPPGTRFYDGLTFHRVIANFMIQGGDPEGTGRGGPGYTFPDEFDPSLRHDRPGILSMANAGPDTNGSQFFITHKATPWLDFKHTVFGQVVSGQAVVDAIRKGDRILKLTIIRKGKEAMDFKSDQAAFDRLASTWKARKAAQKEQEMAAFEQQMQKKYPDAVKLQAGLLYVPLKAGTGPLVKAGDTVRVHYTGRLADGTTFDSSRKRGKPIQVVIGKGHVIKGWDLGIVGMKKGEMRRLVIAYPLAYGAAGYRGIIPPKATLVFDVELMDIQ